MKFSILMPVFNTSLFLDEAIQSVLNQSYGDWELIVLNDGSTDDSETIILKYANLSSKIRYYKQSNKGLLQTRRKLIELSSGEYIVFIDSDDKLVFNHLEKINNVIALHNPEIVLFKYKALKGAKLTEYNLELCNEKGSSCMVDNHLKIYSHLVGSTKLNNLVCKVIQSNFFKNDPTNYLIFGNLKNGEDLLQSIPLLFRAKKIFFLNESLYIYRQHNTSMSKVYDPKTINDIITVNNFLKKYLLSIPKIHYYKKSNLYIHTFILKILVHYKISLNNSQFLTFIKELNSSLEKIDKSFKYFSIKLILINFSIRSNFILLIITIFKRFIHLLKKFNKYE
jgi:glycosyltransferase involved in cell wall biosynthesis